MGFKQDYLAIKAIIQSYQFGRSLIELCPDKLYLGQNGWNIYKLDFNRRTNCFGIYMNHSRFNLYFCHHLSYTGLKLSHMKYEDFILQSLGSHFFSSLGSFERGKI